MFHPCAFFMMLLLISLHIKEIDPSKTFSKMLPSSVPSTLAILIVLHQILWSECLFVCVILSMIMRRTFPPQLGHSISVLLMISVLFRSFLRAPMTIPPPGLWLKFKPCMSRFLLCRCHCRELAVVIFPPDTPVKFLCQRLVYRFASSIQTHNCLWCCSDALSKPCRTTIQAIVRLFHLCSRADKSIDVQS